jgi:predicted RNase H-like HicB family nuclease
MEKPLLVYADWDEDAHVWSAFSDDIPGLATEAETVEALMKKLRTMVPELLELNEGPRSQPIDYELLIRRFDSIKPIAA